MNPMVEYYRRYLGHRDRPEDPPFTRWLGGVLREVEEGALAMDFTVREEMTNPAGLLHGGVVCGILDDVIGFALTTLGLDRFHISINLTVDYLGSARAGDTVTARARVLTRGKIVHARCELANGGGKPIAHGTSNLLRSRLPARFAPHREKDG